jgi:hypothetical protein
MFPNSVLFLCLLAFTAIGRAKGQEGDSAVTETTAKQLSCDYGSGSDVTICSFEVNEDMSHPTMRWKVGTGITAFWLGGPLKDRSTMENTGNLLTN